jgi:hypothetical protein
MQSPKRTQNILPFSEGTRQENGLVRRMKEAGRESSSKYSRQPGMDLVHDHWNRFDRSPEKSFMEELPLHVQFENRNFKDGT